MRELDMDNLSDDDKEWLRNWNRADEIPDDSGQNYSNMKKDQLTSLIEERNAGYTEDEQIVPDGNTKADLIAALEADDGEEG